NLGTFDIVLFLGLLYHLPNPLAGLRIVRDHCRGSMFLETHVIDEGMLMEDGTTSRLAEIDPRLTAMPIIRFYPGSTLNNDASNFWGPNIPCVRDMLTESRFTVVRNTPPSERAIFECVVA